LKYSAPHLELNFQMSSPLTEALSGQFSVKPLTCSSHCGFSYIFFFLVAKEKLQAAELVWKSCPVCQCWTFVEIQLLTSTWAQ